MVPWSKLTRVSPRTELLDPCAPWTARTWRSFRSWTATQLVGVLTREQVLRYVHMRSQLGV